MRGAPSHCPNTACVHHTGTPGRFYGRWGHFTTKHNRQPVPRYRCKACGRLFSAAHTKTRLGQHRPALNAPLFKLLVSGVNARRAAQILGCTRGTVDRKIHHLAKLAQVHHAAMLAELKTSHVMFDELITFLHARPRRVSVAMVVRPITGQVLGFAVCRIPGIEAAQQKYQWFNDDRPMRIPALLKALGPVLKPEATLTSDADPSYPKWIKEAGITVHHRQVKAIVSKLAQKSNERDPLFAINLTFAKMRNDLARLGRKTWTTTKTIDGLERHLWLWVAWTNGYDLK